MAGTYARRWGPSASNDQLVRARTPMPENCVTEQRFISENRGTTPARISDGAAVMGRRAARPMAHVAQPKRAFANVVVVGPVPM